MEIENMAIRGNRTNWFWTGVVVVSTMVPTLVALWVHLYAGVGGTDYVRGWAQMLPVLAVSAVVLLVSSYVRRDVVGAVMPKTIAVSVVAVEAAEIVMGLLQLTGVIASRHPGFAITGTFYNPGPYGGMVAMVVPVGVAACLNERKSWQCAGIALLMLAALVLPASGSRTAWIAAGVSGVYVYACARPAHARELLRRAWWQLMIVVVAAAVGLYMMKSDSADGRLLIWKIALYAITRHPLGVGWFGVPGAYGEAQEAYFSNAGRLMSDDIRVADAPGYMFNEFLQMSLAWGVITGLVCVMLIVSAILKATYCGRYGVAGAIVAFSVFAFASYPLQFPVFVALFVTLLLAAFAPSWFYDRSPTAFRMLCGVVGALSIYGAVVHHDMDRSYCQWDKVRHLYSAKAYDCAAEKMEVLKDGLEWNSHFLFELGHSLNKAGRYDESNRVLEKALKVSSDPMPLNIIGKNYEAMGNYAEATHHYERAWRRVPNRLYPRYLMIKVSDNPKVDDSNLILKVDSWGDFARPKVTSPATEEMSREIKGIVEVHLKKEEERKAEMRRNNPRSDFEQYKPR